MMDHHIHLLLIITAILFVPISYVTLLRIEKDPDSFENLQSTTERPRVVLKSYGELCTSNKDCAFPFVCDTDKTHSCICGANRIAQRLKTPSSSNLRMKVDPNPRIICPLRAGASCSNFRSDFSPGGKYYQESIKNFGKVFLKHLGLVGKLSSTIIDGDIMNDGGQSSIIIPGANGDDSCVENSRCDGYICVCNSGHFKDLKTGECVKKRSIFQRCERDDECGSIGYDLEEQLLTCGRSSNRCECPPHLTFDIRTMKCHIPVGGKCDYFPVESDLECVPDSECSDPEGVCKCGSGLRRTLQGTCGVDHGLPCGNGRSCSDIDLVCRAGRCSCKFPAHQYFDEVLEACVGKVGAPCDLMKTTEQKLIFNDTNHQHNHLFSCTENAECRNRSSVQGDKECGCVEGYAEDENGKCIKSFGADCDDDDSECDEISQLVCLNGKCSCPDALQVFDKVSRKCQGLVGSRCRSTKTTIDNNNNGMTSGMASIRSFRITSIPSTCVKNSICFEPVEGIDGRCECSRGYEEVAGTRRCKRKSSKFLTEWASSSGESI